MTATMSAACNPHQADFDCDERDSRRAEDAPVLYVRIFHDIRCLA